MKNLLMTMQDKMDNLLIMARIKAKKEFDDLMNNEDGDIVQTVIIIAIFAVLAVVVITMISKATQGRANAASDAIEGFTVPKN